MANKPNAIAARVELLQSLEGLSEGRQITLPKVADPVAGEMQARNEPKPWGESPS